MSDPDIWHLSHQGAISFFPLIFLIKQRGRWGEGKKREAEGQQKRKRQIGRNDDPPKKKEKQNNKDGGQALREVEEGGRAMENWRESIWAQEGKNMVTH